MASERHLGDNELIFSLDQLTNPESITEASGSSYREEDLLEKDEQYFFSRD